jgi:uncharacterized protein (DUF488 family)
MTTPSYPTVFTIGHSNLEIGAFLDLLKLHRVEAVADVRSSPYSEHNPQFNRETLRRSLRDSGIAYVFLGDELGARRSEPECYVNGRADYARIAKTPAFRRGIGRIAEGSVRMRVALMCAEKDPLDCHRCVLISPILRQQGLQVRHILTNGSVAAHEEVEARLLHLFDRANDDFFLPPSERVAEAYRQGEKIAYQESTLALHESPPEYGA